MCKIFNNRDETLKRQSLRAEMPVAERLLWKHLRNEALGVKFRRQVSIGRYVVDFYCPSLHLAIEVDGESHAGEDTRAYDEARQREIESLGVRFIRVANKDVTRCALDVADSIALVVAIAPNENNSGKISIMSVKEIERAIAQLPKNELTELMTWLQNHQNEAWDKQIESDLDSGRLDALLTEVEAEYNAGEARPL